MSDSKYPLIQKGSKDTFIQIFSNHLIVGIGKKSPKGKKFLPEDIKEIHFYPGSSLQIGFIGIATKDDKIFKPTIGNYNTLFIDHSFQKGKQLFPEFISFFKSLEEWMQENNNESDAKLIFTETGYFIDSYHFIGRFGVKDNLLNDLSSPINWIKKKSKQAIIISFILFAFFAFFPLMEPGGLPDNQNLEAIFMIIWVPYAVWATYWGYRKLRTTKIRKLGVIITLIAALFYGPFGGGVITFIKYIKNFNPDFLENKLRNSFFDVEDLQVLND